MLEITTKSLNLRALAHCQQHSEVAVVICQQRLLPAVWKVLAAVVSPLLPCTLSCFCLLNTAYNGEAHIQCAGLTRNKASQRWQELQTISATNLQPLCVTCSLLCSSPAANQQFATGTNTNITNIAKHGADITTRSSRKRGLQHQADNRELLQHNAKLQQQQTLFKNCIQLYIGNSGAISGSSNSSSNTPSGTLELVYPTDTQYESLNVRNFQQAALHRRPLAFALPYTTEDVAAIVKCTNIANIRFTVRSGGHSYEGNSLIHQALVIDMTNMDWVVIDQESDTAKIGAGQRLGEIYKVLAEQGNYVLPGERVSHFQHTVVSFPEL